MEQEGPLDFKALRAKFQEEATLKQMKNKPAIPEKPKLIPPPGSRVSLLSSINAAVESKNPVMPRVVFKDSKTEAKRPLPLVPSKPVRDSSHNADVSAHQQKKEGDAVKQSLKDRKLPLVLPVPPVADKPDPAPPTKSVAPKKKGFLPFKSKFSKTGKESIEINAGPTNTSEGPTSTSEGAPNTSEGPIETPENPVNISESSTDTNEGPINDTESPASPSESATENSETAANSSAGLASISEDLPSISEASPNTTDCSFSIDDVPPPVVPEEIVGDAPNLENGHAPHELGLGSEPQSPSSETADAPAVEDETADAPAVGDETEDQVSTGSRTPPCAQRVLNALEKAKRKFTPFNSQARPKSASPVNGELPSEMTPSRLCPELPPIDYEDPIGRAPSAASASPDNRPNGSPLRQSSPSLEGGVEQEDLIPPPRKTLEDLESLGPSPEKPARPPFVDLGPYQTTAPEAYVGNGLEVPAVPGLTSTEPESDTPDCEPVEIEDPEIAAPEVPDFQTSDLESPRSHEVGVLEHGALDLGALDPGSGNIAAPDLGPPESGEVVTGDSVAESQEMETPEAEPAETAVTDSPASSVNKDSEPQLGLQQEEGHYESFDNVYEDVDATKFRRGQNNRKKKGPPKNPYADTQPVNEESHKSSWFVISRNERKASPEAHDDKEQKKKEKQRLEKEKKEQKEREKKENEMKKKFKITGQEEPMYQAKVILASKGRKNDLPLKSGDIVSIIRTTNCPKGKWLARDSNNKYGYISVKSVELDIKEMLELGKKASQAAGRTAAVEPDTASVGSRSSNHYPLSACSFTDDSEEWTCDDDDTLSPTENIGNSQTAPVVDMLNNPADVPDTVDDGNSEGYNMQARHEALQKLATFFQQPKETSDTAIDTSTTVGSEELPSLLYPVEESSCHSEHEEVMEILPPPDLYADSLNEDLPSLPTIGVE